MNYCDFCGQRILSDSKYCRYCGHRLIGKLDDTQPLPIIQGPALSAQRVPGKSYTHLNQNIFMRQIKKFKIKKSAILSYLASFISTVGLIYILVTFKTIDEYQLLTSVIGFLLILYFWRSAH